MSGKLNFEYGFNTNSAQASDAASTSTSNDIQCKDNNQSTNVSDNDVMFKRLLGQKQSKATASK
ncbi:MAG: hypothetical protein ACJAVV_000200 [Alphaproteobacteria bacterium]|jgi:hypothetical protein